MQSALIASPLNYTGGKFKLLPQILPFFPKRINTFIDLFCGGCNVGLNVESTKTIYNDTNSQLVNLCRFFKNIDGREAIRGIYDIISKYELSIVSKYGYAFYNCDSSKGLGEYNKSRFLKLRQDFNATKPTAADYYLLFYVMIVYAFNNQIRFNSNGDFNLPVGKRDFNAKMEQKLLNFIDKLQKQNNEFLCLDFRNFDIKSLQKDDFVYVDPPYLITCATYNENGGWTKQDEKDLLAFLDELDRAKIKFALSNVLTDKGKTNGILNSWLKNRHYNIHHLNYKYSNSNYQIKNRISLSDEVLVVNY
ncbi:adenine-specific DNA methyltransferase [Campylobacter iguaniorum]|uniref:DNA adenine methylase n=1 Tax=Campylobacter iguaniorum TaxID=1244531 RepID=UPI0007C8A2A1|nr:DNA adenine methylase [Campylobacter iguaniorum]ANE36552.1 adenine-specific DNA methyltransferase [Campylobacter iguaniorum]